MDIWIAILVGLVLLIIGGDILVRGATSAARTLGVSPLVIGLTLVGFGTSTPELVISLQAAFAGSPGIAVGNVVGSNISNALLILGLTALISPILVDRRAFLRDGPVLALATAGSIWALLQGELGRTVGMIGVGLLVGYIVLVWLLERKAPGPEGERIEDEADLVAPGWLGSLWVSLILAAGGIAVTIIGAGILVDGSVSLARSMGVSDTIVGLTIVAVGTSAPELVTSITAALRRQGDVALGNVIGSNLYNLLGILGVTAIVKPIAVPPEILGVDIWVLAAATGAAILFALRGMKIHRHEGAALVAGYLAYTAWLLHTAGAF
ncbi:calcium/sodium antiporter [Caulobacter sp. NIBR1757]|uniref:calcium/sodium antiporter n=1 Tax=Caulobacter sp. NIBR1757 TaxID=3016000 RepID=UPI0022F09D40|nr:calcium/sodium antiporter [Caulobacter sp. NIBR1757]WGM41068.1 Inner membrane protein YrbG [Caulobacter sp. NIBR1757]